MVFFGFHGFHGFHGSMFCGPCWSGGPVGLVGPWVWWACGSGGGPVGLMGPWVWRILLVVDC